MDSVLGNDPVWTQWKKIAHKFRYTNFIQNLGGGLDTENPPPSLVRDVLRDEPETFILHSQPVARAAAKQGGGPAEDWVVGDNPVTPPLARHYGGLMGMVAIIESPGVIRDGKHFIIAGDPGAHYVAAILSGHIRQDAEIEATITFELVEPANLVVSFFRHGTTPFEGNGVKSTFGSGENTFAIRHKFNKDHDAARIQIGCTEGSAKIAVKAVQAKEIEKAA